MNLGRPPSLCQDRGKPGCRNRGERGCDEDGDEHRGPPLFGT
jgi:hypothetical protein